MYKNHSELSVQQITEAVDSLPPREKIKLAEKLERETTRYRWRKILKTIDARLKRFPISQEDVLREIAAYRRAKHA